MKSARRGLTVGLVLVGLGTGLVAYRLLSGGAEPTATGVHRIVYRVEDHSRLPVRVTTQVLDVAPPYEARLVTLDGPPPGAASLGGVAWGAAHQYLLEAGGEVREIQQTPPGFPGAAAHLDVALPAALRLRLVERRETSEVAGVACTQWLSKEPLDSAEFSLPTPTDRVVTCVDDAGRILREQWTLNGTVVRLRTAVSVGPGPALSAGELFGGRTPVPAPSGLSSASVKVVPVEQLAKALGIPVPAEPPGLRLDRSVALIDTDSSGPTPQIVREGGVISFTDGRRLIVLSVHRGLLRAVAPPAGGVAVTVPGVGAGRLTPTLSGLRVQFLTPRGLLVTVTGDLPEQTLLDWVGLLRFG